MPLLEQAASDYEGRVTFVGLASKDDRSSALSFLDDVGVTYPNLFNHSGEVRSELDLRGFPTTYVFDGTGELRDAIVGGVSEQQLAALLDRSDERRVGKALVRSCKYRWTTDI